MMKARVVETASRRRDPDPTGVALQRPMRCWQVLRCVLMQRRRRDDSREQTGCKLAEVEYAQRRFETSCALKVGRTESAASSALKRSGEEKPARRRKLLAMFWASAAAGRLVPLPRTAESTGRTS